MTWGELKDALEKRGIQDDEQIAWIGLNFDIDDIRDICITRTGMGLEIESM